VKTLLHCGWSIGKNVYGTLRAAVSSGSADTVDVLLTHIMKYNCLRNDDISPLLGLAAQDGHVEVVQLLLSTGICPDIDISGALYLASRNIKSDMIILLLSTAESRGYGDIRTWFQKDVNDIMMRVLSTGNMDAINALVAAGVSIDYSNADMFRGAARGNCVDLVNKFLDHIPSFPIDIISRVLVDAAERGHVDVVRAILNTGIDARKLDNAALFCALGSFRPDAAKVLFEAGMRIVTDCRGKTPLMMAALCGSADVVKGLLWSKADVNSVYDVGDKHYTAVSFASKPEIVRMLIDAKADMNPKDCVSVLLKACAKIQPESVKMLLHAGARIRKTKYADECVYRRVLLHECTEETAKAKLAVVELFLNESRRLSADVSRFLPAVSEDPCMERIIDAVLQRHPELLNSVDYRGKTLLSHSVENKKVRMVKYLVSIGAEVNNRSAVSLLSLLIYHRWGTPCPRSRAILRILTDAGLDLSERDDMDRTTFMNALRGNDDWVSVTFIRDMAETVLIRGLSVATVYPSRNEELMDVIFQYEQQCMPLPIERMYWYSDHQNPRAEGSGLLQQHPRRSRRLRRRCPRPHPEEHLQVWQQEG
jgi:ankyrin repeat protein